MNVLMIAIVAFSLGGCLSASTNAKLCADLNVANKVVGGVNENAGKLVAEYTPKKCVNGGINGDLNKLSGGVSAGITNE